MNFEKKRMPVFGLFASLSVMLSVCPAVATGLPAHNVGRSDPERKAMLEAVREANVDLNDRVPIVFVVEVLRSDGETAYFRGKVRRKADGRPISAEIWGQCEQEPETALLEALLQKHNGRWLAVQANRCADDVFLSDADRLRYRALMTDK